MILKKYIVESIDEVQPLINQDLGPEAAILTSREIKKKGLRSLFGAQQFEIIAGVEEKDFRLHQGHEEEEEVIMSASYENQESTSQPQTTPQAIRSKEWESPAESITSSNVNAQSFPGLEEPSNYSLSDIPGTYLDPRFNRKNTEKDSVQEGMQNQEYYENKGTSTDQSHFHHHLEEVKKDKILEKSHSQLTRALNDLSQIVSELKEVTTLAQKTTNFNDAIVHVIKKKNALEGTILLHTEGQKVDFILEQTREWGLSEELSTVLMESVLEKVSKEDISVVRIKELLKKQMLSLLEVTGPITLEGKRPIVIFLCGQPTENKVISILHLARMYILQANTTVGVIAYSTESSDVNQLLKNRIEDEDIPFAIAETESELQSALKLYSSFDLILVAADRSAFGSDIVESIKKIPSIQFVEVMEAGRVEQEDPAFPIFAESLFITGITEKTLPELFNASFKFKKPLSYYLKNDILHIADPLEIIHSFG